MPDFTITEVVRAPAETVFDVLTDHAAYSTFTPLRVSKLEREGSPDRNGVGAVRSLGVAGPPLREEVTEFARPTRFAYKLISGLPVKEHTGVVDLIAQPDGTTRVEYHVHSVPKFVPGFAQGAVGATMKPIMGQLVTGVKKRAESLAGAAG